MNLLLDEIIRETNRAGRAWLARIPDTARPVAHEHAQAELSRLSALAERSGPKGALAGHLDELLRLS